MLRVVRVSGLPPPAPRARIVAWMWATNLAAACSQGAGGGGTQNHARIDPQIRLVDARDFIETGGTAEGLPGGTGELFVNGKKVGEVEMPEMHISTFSLSETFDVGIDAGTPVSNKYRVTNHYPFTGDLDKVVVKLTD